MSRELFSVLAYAIALAAIAASTAPAEDDLKNLSAAPRLVLVSRIDQQRGELHLVDITVRFFAEKIVREEKKDGKVETTIQTTHKPVYESLDTPLALESAEVFDAAGKQLSSEAVRKRVEVGTVVLVSSDGKKVNPAFLDILAKDTLVFVSPQYAHDTRPLSIAK